MQKRICVLGSTGSIGTQTLDVAKHLDLKIIGLSVNSNIDVLEKQVKDFDVKICAVADEKQAEILKKNTAGTGLKVLSGKNAAKELAQCCDCNTVVNAIIGFAGLEPTLAGLESGKNVAIANKETLVSAGELVMNTARKNRVEIMPIDSEHCALHQCLRAGKHSEVKRLIVTGSGGPFFGYTKEKLKTVTKEQALKHPNWSMGKGITVYSSTLVNKGLEMIEAMRLYDIPMEKIDVIIHRESIVHSLVEFCDGSMLAQLAKPDMRLCIQYALTYPDRIEGLTDSLDLAKVSKLTFYDVDNEVFPSVELARRAVKYGGTSTCVYNAANEQCVDLFLADKIGYTDIFDIMDNCVENIRNPKTDLENIINDDKRARELVNKLSKKA